MWVPNSSRIITAEQKEAAAYTLKRKEEFPDLLPDQFWFVLRAAGYQDDVLAWVSNLGQPKILIDGEEVENPEYDPIQWAWASSKLEFASFFERDHPLVLGFQKKMNMSEMELNALWKFAANS